MGALIPQKGVNLRPPNGASRQRRGLHKVDTELARRRLLRHTSAQHASSRKDWSAIFREMLARLGRASASRDTTGHCDHPSR